MANLKQYVSLVPIFLLVGAITLIAGCTRGVEDKASFKITLPSKEAFNHSVSQKGSQKVGSLASSLVDFDCLAVLISAPEPVYNQNTCSTSGNGTFKTGKPIGSFTFLSGSPQEIEIALPRGNGRLIRVIGFEKTGAACPPNLEDEINNPHIIGQSAPFNNTGSEATVNIALSFSAANALTTCDGPDFAENNGPSGPYLRVEGLHNYELGTSNASPKQLTRGMCYEISFMPYEPCNGGACTILTPTNDVTVNFANNNLKIYTSESICQADSGPIPSMIITGGASPGTHGSPTYSAWMRIPLDKTNVTSLSLSSEISIPGGSELEYASGNFNVGKPVIVSTGFTHAPGANLVSTFNPGECSNTNTTFTAYQAGTTPGNYITPNQINSHEPFNLINAGLELMTTECTYPINFSPGSASVSGMIRYKNETTLGLVGGDVYKAIALANAPNAGKFILAGGFASYSGLSRLYIVRVFASGELDTSFKTPVFNGAIFDALELPNGSLLVSGSFSTVDGVARPGIARLHSDGTFDSTFNISLTGSVETLALHNDTLYLGGTFTDVGGSPRTNIASLNYATLTVSSWAPNPNGPVRKILVADNAIFVGGYFTSIESTTRNYLASFDLNTGILSGWNPSPTGFVFSIEKLASPPILFVGGTFSTIADETRPKVAAFSGNDASPSIDTNLTFEGATIDNSVWTIKRSYSHIYVGGDLSTTGNNLVRFNFGNGAYDAGFNPDIKGTVRQTLFGTGLLMAFGGITQHGKSGTLMNRYLGLAISSGTPDDLYLPYMNPRRATLDMNKNHFDFVTLRAHPQ